MPTGPRAAAAVLAAALLAGCGTQTAQQARSDGPATASASARPCAAPRWPADGGAQGGVRIASTGAACAEYEVTNTGGEPADVTVAFSLLSAAGEAMDTVTRTLPAIAPGASAKDRIDPPAGSRERVGAGWRVKIITVRSVPTSEAPAPAGPCPPSGLRLWADEGDAAMGLRVVGLHLRNCGTAAVTLDGYPQLQLLDLEHRPVDGVSVLRGGAAIATGTGADDPPQQIALRPGEGARSTLVWRNTTGAGEAVNAPYVRVRATPDAAPVTVTPDLDLGTTGRLGVGAWVRENGAS
ncbi:DUF4232 domain-containing protein [Streptomyces sp. FH025]|uniref:DUF4232 domain-containing protein n=1 Tax=Streptomyces sp. FH025 TaxID=2815937 RepID=UPI001FAFB285|nr:DUF4232 domain-containing protein [Streptomyces sp. FH025]